jgi:hypothetical protein
MFLVGSIEIGVAEEWQNDFSASLSDLPVSIFNPSRDDYDSSWPQHIPFPPFREQVEWELDHLEKLTWPCSSFKKGLCRLSVC